MAGPSPALSYNNNSLGSGAYPSCISQAADSSPVIKPHTVVTSLSFNRGTMNKTAIQNNGSAVTRAASFQSRFNPNGYSAVFGASSDNDSLHSSTSSLEYSGGVSKLMSYPSPSAPEEYHQQHPDGSTKFSQACVVPGVIMSGPGSCEVNFGSKPGSDLQIRNGEGGVVGMSRNGAGGRLSPGFTGCFHNTNSFHEENVHKNNLFQKQAPPAKDKKTPRLNKFPLDLDSIVSTPSVPSHPKVQQVSESCVRAVCLKNTDELMQRAPSFTVASPSASQSSLNSSAGTPTFSLYQAYANLSPNSLSPSPGSILVPEVSSSPVPLSPAQTPHLEILSKPQVSQMDSKLHSPYSFLSPSSPKAKGFSELDLGDVRDSVGSILQRIASFSQPAVPNVLVPLTSKNNGTCPTFVCATETVFLGQLEKMRGKTHVLCGYYLFYMHMY